MSYFTLCFWYFYLLKELDYLFHHEVLVFIFIQIHIFLGGLSISWQEICGTHGVDNSQYIGPPGSCFTPSATARHRGSATVALKPGSCSPKTVSLYLLQLFIL